MEDRDWAPRTGKQPCGVGAGAPGFGPGGRLRGGGGCSRSRERDVSPGDCFAERLVWLAAGRSLGSGGAQGRAGRRAASRMLPARAGACTCVCTVGRCKACARHGRDARQCRRPAPRHTTLTLPGENTAQNLGSGPGAAARWPEEPSRSAGPTPRPAVQSANTEPQHQQIGQDAGKLSTHPGRGASPQDRHAPRQAERATAPNLARSPRDLGNHSEGGY